MTYQTAYKLLVAAYKSAKGIMPEGLDLLKIKQKARQKVIDAKKVIQFPPDRITNPFKPRPTETEIMMNSQLSIRRTKHRVHGRPILLSVPLR